MQSKVQVIRDNPRFSLCESIGEAIEYTASLHTVFCHCYYPILSLCSYASPLLMSCHPLIHCLPLSLHYYIFPLVVKLHSTALRSQA